MTTIAYKNGVLATDSASVSNGWMLGEVDKIFDLGESGYGAGAGEWALVNAAARHIALNPTKRDGVKTGDSSTFVWFKPAQRRLGPDRDDPEWARKIVVFERDTWYEADPAMWHAWGSGSVPALAAMEAGADAERAVVIACRIDTDSGGDVQARTVFDD